MTEQAVRHGTPTAGGRPDGGCFFVGRDRELRRLRTDLESAGLGTLAGRPAPHSRVLLVAGRPGSGRTTLAEAFVREVAGRYPDGVLRARLTDPGGMPVPTERTARDLLTALGAGGAPPGADPDDLTAVLRSELARRRVLLFCDDVAAAEQLGELVPENRDCLVVAVASGPLTGVPDIRPCAMGGIDRAAAVELLRSRVGTSPRLTVDPRRAESLAEACGDLPAALRMVGGWLAARPKLSVSDATAQLLGTPDGHPDTGGTSGTRTPDFLARAFHLVAGSLPAPAGRLLRFLAVAPAGFVDAQHASALTGCSPETAEETLHRLHALGLLHHAAPGCWTVPGCLDPLLRAELDARERPAEVMLARARMLERTVRRLHACRAVTEPPGSPARTKLAGMPRPLRFDSAREARDWLELRRPSLLAAARLAVAEGAGELDTLLRRLVHALGRCFAAHRTPEEAAPEVYRLQELALQVAERRALEPDRAAALLALADMDAAAGRLAAAGDRYRRALDAARACRDGVAATVIPERLGDTHGRLGDWARAADWYGRALSLRESAGDPHEVARLHGLVADAQARNGDTGEALRTWRAAAALHRRLRDPAGRGRALGEVGRLQQRRGRPDEALRSCREALAEARRARDPLLQAELRMCLADVCDAAGDPVAAARHRSAGEELRDLTER
ncbi:tetratricopeptide repeat protein [Streptomyces sp. RKND-216]|uniref:tetratricopeptide repeat protein n=1 Tax=Streptomyces sp. RKND-216 TaxID=2562581 RepID=UPI001FF74DFA|nr:tetratricopeptide repeat protein [Streptomyces sp. RKND-216]